MTTGKTDKSFGLAMKGRSKEYSVYDNSEVLPPRWFCAAESTTGDIIKKEADSPEGLLQICEPSVVAWVDYWSDNLEKDASSIAAQFGFSDSLIYSLVGDYATNYQDFDTEMGLQLPSVYMVNYEVQSYPLLMLARKNFILTIHPLSTDRRFARLRRYADTVLKKIPPKLPQEDKLTELFVRIIDINNDRNFDQLRVIEDKGDTLSESLLDPKVPRDQLGLQIYQIKHALITYLDALWETVDVLHTLRYGDAELITNDLVILQKMGMLTDDVNRQIELSEHMSEVLASGLEVLQSIYNNQLQALNNRLALVMTYLTIVGTAVLVPNTLATIFSNSIFSMGPEDVGWYITMLIGSTVLATGLVYLWIKKMGWLPKKPD